MNQAAFVAVIKDDLVLLVRSRTTPGYVNHWSLPGGLVEFGDLSQAGAKREAIEETNIVCEVGALLCEVDNRLSNIHVSIYQANYISGNITIDIIEIAEANWFTKPEALTLPFAFNIRSIIENLTF